MKGVVILIFCFLFFSLVGGAWGHRVEVFPYWEGDEVRVEAFFSDGTPVRNGSIKVYDPEGKLIFKGQTDAKGTLDFRPLKKETLKIVLEASMGHRAEATLSPPAEEGAVGGTAHEPPPAISRGDIGAIKRAVREAVAEELRPIIAELVRRRARPSVRDAIGGIGWIIGLTGLWFYLRARRDRGG